MQAALTCSPGADQLLAGKLLAEKDDGAHSSSAREPPEEEERFFFAICVASKPSEASELVKIHPLPWLRSAGSGCWRAPGSDPEAARTASPEWGVACSSAPCGASPGLPGWGAAQVPSSVARRSGGAPVDQLERQGSSTGCGLSAVERAEHGLGRAFALTPRELAPWVAENLRRFAQLVTLSRVLWREPIEISAGCSLAGRSLAGRSTQFMGIGIRWFKFLQS